MAKRFTFLIALVLAASLAPASAARAQSADEPRQSSSSAAALSPALPTGQPAPGVFRFVAIGDTGTGGKDQLAVAQRMAAFHDERPYETVILLGDNVYPQGSPAELPRKFERPYAELLRRGVRFHAALGNHDVQRGRTAQTNYELFNMGGRAYYSFKKGSDLVEFFALDSTAMDEAQLGWLDEALGASVARWKIVYCHHPLYSSGKRHGSDMKLRARLEPLLVRHAVAAVFSGHDHFYERTVPRQGVQYFVSGAGGKIRRGNLDRRGPHFAAGNDQVHSFMYVEIAPEQLNFWAVGADGNVLDHGTLLPTGGVEKVTSQ